MYNSNIIGKEKLRRQLEKEYNNTNKCRILKRYKLQKEMRSLIDPIHLKGAYSILYTILKK